MRNRVLEHGGVLHDVDRAGPCLARDVVGAVHGREARDDGEPFWPGSFGDGGSRKCLEEENTTVATRLVSVSAARQCMW